MEVLRDEEDFFDLVVEYCERARGMGAVYCEVMVDLQAHTRRGVAVECVMSGLRRAREEVEGRLGVSSVFFLPPRSFHHPSDCHYIEMN